MPYNQPFLLSGQSRIAFRDSRGPMLLAVLLFFLLFGSGSFLIWSKFMQTPSPAAKSLPIAALPPQAAASSSAAAPSPSAMADPVIDDLTLHVQNANAHLQQSLRLQRRAQERTNGVLGALARNYLMLEVRRLQAAQQLSEDAIREATATFEELQVADQQLKSQGGNSHD